MGYLDYAGLQYLWGKLKEKFAPKSHSHDDRYYTESEMDGKLNSKVNNNEAGANGLLSKLGTSWTATPTDNTYFIRQDTNGKNEFGRVKFSTIWSYIKGKADDVYLKLSGGTLTGSLHITGTASSKPLQVRGIVGCDSDGTTDGELHLQYGVNSPIKLGKDAAYSISADGGTYTGKANASGTSDTSNSLKPLSSTRPTSMNFNLGSNDYKGKVTYAIASSSTTDGKPPIDSVVQNWSWDSNGYGAQVAVKADANPRMYIRGATSHNGASKWDANWKTVAFTDDKPAIAGTADVANSVDWSKVQNKPSSYPPASHSHAYLPISGGTMSGALTFANNTWNPVGDDVQIGDHNTSGSFYVQGLNGPTNIKLKKKGDTSTGSGDSATITYDGGNLVIDKTIQANLSGNASTATKAVSADKATSAATADKAAKLSTARTVSGGTDITLSFNYDGSGNSTANIGFYSCRHTVNNTNNYPFHRFAKLDANKNAWVDSSMTFLISQDYSGGGYGICRLVYRSNADSSSVSLAAEWLVRKGLSADTVQVAIKTDKTNGAYCDAFYKSSGTYSSVVIRAIASGGRGSFGRTWTLVDSNETGGTTATDKKTSSECWKTIAEAGTALHNQAYSSSASAVDSGYVNSAGTSNSCTGNAATATGVKDYGDTNKTIKIGYAGAGLTTSNLTHIAGYASNGTQIKDVSKTVLQDWIDLNGMINKLSEATADPQDNDYYISQYSGGGTTTTTYHRRPVKALWNYIKGKTDAAYLKLTGGTISGALHLKQPNSGSYNENIRMHPSKSDWSSIVMCGSDNTGDSGTSAKTWGIFTNGGKFGISKNGNGVSAVGDASLVCGDNNVWKANGNELITSATIGSQTVSKASSATTASKLGTNAGSTTNPVYFKDGVPVAGTYTLSDASTKTVRTLTAQGPSGWKDAATDQKYVPDMAFMAYWNGAYSGESSNLQYCDRGRFGTIITKGSGDYLPIGGGTLTGDLKFSDIGDTATSHKISWAGSTDGADIYYQTTAKDQGNLVLNLRDDANCYLRIASNGAFKSYFSPSDGNFHGNVNGNATSASGYTFKSQTSDPGANSSLATGTVLFVYE